MKMLIDKAKIERVKAQYDLAAYVRSRGIRLRKHGKQLVGLCPFHDDHEPSLIIDPSKKLWNCLGVCNEGGDIYKFVMKMDSVDFREAHRRLTMNDESERVSEEPQIVTASPAIVEMDAEALAWLERVTAHYHRTLLQTPTAQDYLTKRGIISRELVTTFRLGFADGSLIKIVSDDGREHLKRISVLSDEGKELMRGCVVFPLVNADTNHVVNLYGRHTTRRQHLYLPGERRGIFNPTAAKNADEIIITESVIDAAALWSTGIRNIIPTYGTTGLTDEIIALLVDNRVTRAVLMLDADDAGRRAAEEMRARLAVVNIEARNVELPAKDASQFIASGGTLEQLRSLITPSIQSETTTPTLAMETSDEGIITFKLNEREYRIRGVSPVGLDRLKVNVRLTVESRFHLDTFDLYQARSRQLFAHTAAKLCHISEQLVSADLLAMIEQLEAVRLEMRRTGADENAAAMTLADRDAALSFLQSSDLCARIIEDFRRCGFVGDKATVLTAYLAAVSRKLSEPLAVLISPVRVLASPLCKTRCVRSSHRKKRLE